MSIDRLAKTLAFRVLEEQGEKPQFEADHLSDIQEFLDERGVLYTVEQVPANELTVLDSESLNKSVVREKAKRIKEKEKAKPIVVSEEYDIIDGRHEARAVGEVKGEDHKLPVLRVHLPSSEATGMLGDIEKQLNEDQRDMKTIAVFSGRFQPFHRGHYKVYEHLRDRFGRNNTYIGTSNKVDPPRSPFTFDQKKKIITTLFDIPHENVVEVKNPYGPKEITGQYDPETTAYVAAVSEKDKGRLLGSSYFDEWPPDGEVVGYEEGGYVYTTPMAGFTFRGDEISGTRVREAFRNEDIPEEEKKDFFRYIYGSFNEEIYNLLTKQLTESNNFRGKLIEAFLIDRGIGRAVKTAKKKIAYQTLQESSTVTKFQGADIDDGPTTWYSDLDEYQEEVSEQAKLFGFEVLDYITDRVDNDFKEDGLPYGTFFPAGIGPEGATDDPAEIYEPFATAVAEAAGYELLSWMGTLDQEDIRSLYHADDENIAMALGDAGVGTEVDDDDDLEGEASDGAARGEELEGESETLEEITRSVKKNLLTEGGGAGNDKKTESNDMVICKECEKKYSQIQYRHLECKHDMTMEEYKEKYPNANLVSQEARQKLSKNNPMNSKRNRQKVSENNPMNKEKHRTKVSESLSGRERPEMRGKSNPAKKDEVRKKISEAVKRSYKENPELRELRAKTVGQAGYSEEYKERMYKNGEWIHPKEKEDFREYKERVKRLTEKEVANHSDKFDLEKRSRNGHHIDHEYSAQSAFQNNIRPEVVSHHSNLRLIPHHINESKGSDNSKTKEQFIRDVAKTDDGRNLLQAGGGAGHMNHPFEDLDLHFGDLKNMINLAFDGNLDIEQQPIEKVDGQNLLVSWKNGDLVAARNKGHLKNFGENAMDLKGVVKKFEGYGAVQDAFEQAFRDLSIALSEVRDQKLQEMFEDGKKWMNLEVIYPAAKNIVSYGDSFIVFHGIIEHDKDGNAVDFKKDAAYRLADLVEEVDQKVQEEYEILSPPEVELPNLQLEDLRQELIGEVEDYMAEYDMSNDNLVMDWHEEWWEEFIREKADEFDYDIPEHVVAGLIKRWAWGNKSGEDGYGLRTFKSEVDHEDFKNWADSFDKNDYKEQFKENIKPIEEVFLKLGGELLKRVETVLSTDPDSTREDIRQQIQDVRAELEGAADQDKIEKLQSELERLKKSGGMDDFAALEGVVFQYDGNTYKLTGQFASINQAVGVMKFGNY